MITAENLQINQLQIVKMLKMNKVFLVKQGNDYAVMKGESIELIGRKKGEAAGMRRMNVEMNWGGDTPQVKKSIKTASDIIGFVTGDVGGIYTLTGAQQTEWVNKLIATPNIPCKNGTHTVDDEMKRLIDDRMVWSVMDAYSNLEDFFEQGLAKNSVLTKKGFAIKTVLSRDPNLFNALGRIVILDCFLCNTDRFGYDYSKPQPGDIINMGNIFVTWDVQRTFRFIGVDFFSVDSGCSYLGVNWNTIINTPQPAHGYANAIRHFNVLKQGRTSERNRMAKALVDALRRQTQLIINSKVEKAFRQGLHEGRELLKEYYIQQVNKYDENQNLNWPNGLESRFQALGW